MKGKIPQWEVIAYSALDTGNVYMIQNKWLLSPSRDVFLIYTKLDYFSPICMDKSASQMYMAHFHNSKTKIKAHKWVIV